MSEKIVTCAVCGAEIDVETGETTFVAGTNAAKITELQEKNKTLQEGTVKLMNQIQELQERMQELNTIKLQKNETLAEWAERKFGDGGRTEG